MRGMKIRKSALMLSLITSILAVTLAVAPAYAQVTKIAAPAIVDTSLTPGSTFSVNITVDDVSLLWGYMFTLSYDTTVLTAVSAAPWPGPPPVFFAPFYQPLPSRIDDTLGLVELSAGTWYGDPTGVATTEPVAIAKIDFKVDQDGYSPLDLSNTMLVDVYGNILPHEVADGSFTNLVIPPGTRIADLWDWGAKVEHHTWFVAKDSTNTLKGRVMNLGDVEFKVKVVFTITDEEGLWSGKFETLEDTIPAGTAKDLTYDVNFAVLPGYGKYFVSTQAWYDGDGDGIIEYPGATVNTRIKFSAKM